jgi:nicotinamide-nucleotide amidase
VPGKPVGTVWLAWGLSPAAASAKGSWAQAEPAVWSERLQLDGDRDTVRYATVRAALKQLLHAAR